MKNTKESRRKLYRLPIDLRIASFIVKVGGGLLTILAAFLHKLLMLNMYTDCYQLPVMNYIDIISLKDIKKYKRTFFPVTVSCYREAIESVSNHLLELSKNTKVQTINRVASEIERLKQKYESLVIIGIVLEHRESEISLLNLKQLGYDCKDRESALKRIIAAMKNISINIKLLEKEYEDTKESGTNKATSKAEFITQKQILNKMGYNINEKSSTADYILSIGLVGDEKKRLEIAKSKPRTR